MIEGRIIHDLSASTSQFIDGRSSQTEFPPLNFEPVRRLAEPIELLSHKYSHLIRRKMKGEVKGDFRHIPVAATLAHYFAALFSQSTFVDLAFSFG